MEWMQLGSFILNLLLLPLLAVLWDIRIKMAVLEVRVCALVSAQTKTQNQVDEHINEQNRRHDDQRGA